MQTPPDREGRTKGLAICALRAHVKELEAEHELHAGVQDSRYRYQIDDTRGTAVVLDTHSGVVKFEDTITGWAAKGRTIRLAFVGLRAAKLQLQSEVATNRADSRRFRYHLDVTHGQAFISDGEQPVPGFPSDIKQWEAMGRPVEQQLFTQLKAAQLRGALGEIRRLTSLMKTLGLIRHTGSRPRERRTTATQGNHESSGLQN